MPRQKLSESEKKRRRAAYAKKRRAELKAGIFVPKQGRNRGKLMKACGKGRACERTKERATTAPARATVAYAERSGPKIIPPRFATPRARPVMQMATVVPARSSPAGERPARTIGSVQIERPLPTYDTPLWTTNERSIQINPVTGEPMEVSYKLTDERTMELVDFVERIGFDVARESIAEMAARGDSVGAARMAATLKVAERLAGATLVDRAGLAADVNRAARDLGGGSEIEVDYEPDRARLDLLIAERVAADKARPAKSATKKKAPAAKKKAPAKPKKK